MWRSLSRDPTKRQVCVKCQRRWKIARFATQVLFITVKTQGVTQPVTRSVSKNAKERERREAKRKTHNLHGEPALQVEAGRKREETHSEILTKLTGRGVNRHSASHAIIAGNAWMRPARAKDRRDRFLGRRPSHESQYRSRNQEDRGSSQPRGKRPGHPRPAPSTQHREGPNSNEARTQTHQPTTKQKDNHPGNQERFPLLT